MDNNTKLDIDKVKIMYKCWQTERDHYLSIDKYYFGNTEEHNYKNFNPFSSKQRVKVNFIQKIVDEESNYSFGNKVTLKALDDNHKEAVKLINYYNKFMSEGYEDSIGKRLVEFSLGYEIKYTDKLKRFKCKWVTPLNGYMYFNAYDEAELFMYVHTKKQCDEKDKEEIVNYMDIYDDRYVYYLNDKFNVFDIKPHNLGYLPVGCGIINNVKYTEENGYVEGDKTIYRTIKAIQDAYEQNLSDITQEITDFHNAILKMYGVSLQDKKDKEGNVILNKEGNPIKDEPKLKDKSIFYFNDKNVCDAEWLIKNINDTFIKNSRDTLYDLIYILTSHVDNNEKMQSNLSGVALRSKLLTLEQKCKANENAMADIIRERIRCLFYWFKLNGIGEFDANMIEIVFTPCVPQDLASLGDFISKIDHEVMSNETKMGMLPQIDDVEAEKDRIKKENEEAKPKIDLNEFGGDVSEED